MFITDIDKFIDTQFNFIREYVSKHKYDNNFISYYNKITNAIDYSKIYKNINNDQNKKKIRSIIEKYSLFYLLLYLGIIEDLLQKRDKDEKKFIERLFKIWS